MTKIDLTKIYPDYYRAGKQPSVVEFPEAFYLSILGKGDPDDTVFQQRLQALYTIAYTIKFVHKLKQKDFVVPKLEGLWWFDREKYAALSLGEAPLKIPRNEWHYRLLLRVPKFVTQGDVTAAIAKALRKSKTDLVREVFFFELTEGKCVQMTHLGPFDKEPETLQKMQDFMNEHQLVMNGLHHEIYLSDFRRTEPGKLKTILREPVR